MPQKALVYRLLVASPSDCFNERKAIPEVIHSWNATHSQSTGAILEPVLWESHATPQLGNRPQEIINQQIVDDCDFLIGVFWTRIGTHTGKAASGTVEEIERFRKAGKPVLLYFSSMPVVPDSIDQKQYASLLDYRKSIENQGIVFRYTSVGELRELLYRHITKTILSIHSPESIGILETSTIEEPEDILKLRAFKSQFESFLRRLEAEWVSERDSGPINTNDGKHILEVALSELLDYHAQVINDEGVGLSSIIENACKDIRTLGRHRTCLDGGKSFKEFWVKGDLAIKGIKEIPLIIDKHLKEN